MFEKRYRKQLSENPGEDLRLELSKNIDELAKRVNGL